MSTMLCVCSHRSFFFSSHLSPLRARRVRCLIASSKSGSQFHDFSSPYLLFSQRRIPICLKLFRSVHPHTTASPFCTVILPPRCYVRFATSLGMWSVLSYYLRQSDIAQASASPRCVHIPPFSLFFGGIGHFIAFFIFLIPSSLPSPRRKTSAYREVPFFRYSCL